MNKLTKLEDFKLIYGAKLTLIKIEITKNKFTIEGLQSITKISVNLRPLKVIKNHNLFNEN